MDAQSTPTGSFDNGSFSSLSSDSIASEALTSYKLLEVVGRGSFSTVWKALNIETGEIVSIKSIATPANPLESRIPREIDIMKKICHENIVEFKAVVNTSKTINIVMEYVDGSTLLEYIRKHKAISNRRVFHIVRQLVLAVSELHAHGICHRDIKLENILITKEKTVKLIDFGLSKDVAPLYRCNTPCGSIHYAAPEIVGGDDYNPMVADMWSLGTVLYTLVQHRMPFVHSDPNVVRQQVRGGALMFHRPVQREMESLLRRLLERDPATRYTCEQIQQHEYWVTNLKKYCSEPTPTKSVPEKTSRAEGIWRSLFPFLRKCSAPTSIVVD